MEKLLRVNFPNWLFPQHKAMSEQKAMQRCPDCAIRRKEKQRPKAGRVHEGQDPPSKSKPNKFHRCSRQWMLNSSETSLANSRPTMCAL
mmetsp:Transcript_11780/g.30867  ORF Transcript_11780/g.30867 Transcript_11780/m.30867 type:complete len:89 (+) Transcript_11780:348-614(+)